MLPASLRTAIALIALVGPMGLACTSGHDGAGGEGGDSDAGAGGGGAGGTGGAGGSAGAGGGGPADTMPPDDMPPPAGGCMPGEKKGMAGKVSGLRTKGGLGYIVRTPDGYDPTVTRPFIAVYAPASISAAETESFTGLTTPALARGYIIAYADHRSPASVSTLSLGHEMVAAVAEAYCVDVRRIYLTGHSDGGTIAAGISIYINPDLHPAAIAPSAPGLNLVAADVPMQFPFGSIVIQSKDDALFPGKGRKLAQTLAGQAGCDPTPGAPLPSGCIAWSGCKDGQDVQYCEGTGPHGVWQKKYTVPLLDFFDAHTRP